MNEKTGVSAGMEMTRKYCITQPLVTVTSLTSGGVKLEVWAQTSPLSEMIQSCTCFSHASKMPTFRHNRTNSFIIKNAIILNILHNIYNLRDTEVNIYI